MPLPLAPSVLLTGSLQWISLLCVCLLSHCGGRQTCQSPEAASACLAVRGHVSEASLSMVFGNIPVHQKAPSQHCASSVRHAVEFIRCGPSARATMATVFHILLCRAGIHQPDQVCQRVTYHTSGGSPTSTNFALSVTLYGLHRRGQDTIVGINLAGR